MKLLALETSGHVGSVALLVDGDVRQETIPTLREQTAQLLPLTGKLLGGAGLKLRDLHGIAFGRGPGSFTGLRIAAAVAQGLGLATGVPLLPVSSLAATAQGLWRTHRCARLLVCVDARMGEVYWGDFEIRRGLAHAASKESLTAPEDVQAPGGYPWSAAGSGFGIHGDALASLIGRARELFPDAGPNATDLFPQAREDLAAGRGHEPEEANPVYLRSETAWRRVTDPK